MLRRSLTSSYSVDMPALEPERPPRRGRVAAHQVLGEAGLPLLDGVDNRVMLAVAGHEDGINLVEGNAVGRDDARGNERHRIDAVDQVGEQRVASAADDKV